MGQRKYSGYEVYGYHAKKISMRKALLALGLWGLFLVANAQPVSPYFGYAKSIMDTLSSGFFYGRGHIEEGERRAAYYVATEFQKMNLKKFAPAPSYYQVFKMSVNVFPEVPSLAIDRNWLICGKMYIPDAASGPIRGEFNLVWIDSSVVHNEKLYKKIAKSDLSKSFLVLDDRGISDEKLKKILINIAAFNPLDAAGILTLSNKLTFSISTTAKSFPHLHVHRNHISRSNNSIRVNLQTSLVPEVSSSNVTGYILGKKTTDTMVVVTAHYDHLGQIGRHVIFPGANDNASGTAMMLALAKYFSQPENQPDYSMAFIAFGAEEAGLLGSSHYIKNPIIPLSRIKFLVNLDLMANGEEGITVVNAVEQKKAFSLLERINKDNGWFKEIKSRENAANSDHFPFTQMRVPAIFMYTMGGPKSYHDIYDQKDSLPWNTFNPLFGMLTHFLNEIQHVE
jgi:aminopeptidase YwaD